jgi:hypothetical protein
MLPTRWSVLAAASTQAISQAVGTTASILETFPAAMLERTGRRTVGHQGFATAMAAIPPIPGDDLRRDRSFQPASACRRSSAGIQPGRSTQHQGPLPFWSRSRSLAQNQVLFEFRCWRSAGFHPCQPTIGMRCPGHFVRICWPGSADRRSARGECRAFPSADSPHRRHRFFH